MIIKSYEFNKSNIIKNIFLFYGSNEGLKNSLLDNIFKKNYDGNIIRYEEKEVLSNIEEFYNNIFTKSFFEKKKIDNHKPYHR